MQLLDLWITCIIFLFFMDSKCPLLSTYCSYKQNKYIAITILNFINNLCERLLGQEVALWDNISQEEFQGTVAKGAELIRAISSHLKPITNDLWAREKSLFL